MEKNTYFRFLFLFHYKLQKSASILLSFYCNIWKYIKFMLDCNQIRLWWARWMFINMMSFLIYIMYTLSTKPSHIDYILRKRLIIWALAQLCRTVAHLWGALAMFNICGTMTARNVKLWSLCGCLLRDFSAQKIGFLCKEKWFSFCRLWISSGDTAGNPANCF